jgi:hypothetical protein
VQQRHFNNLSDLFDLLFAAANIIVSDIGFVLHLHHRDGWVDLLRQRQLNTDFRANKVRVFAAHAHALLDVSWGELLVKADNVLAEMFEANDVFRLGGARIDDLGQTAHHHALLLHELLVGWEVPLGRQGQACVGLLNSNELCYFLVKAFDLVLYLF